MPFSATGLPAFQRNILPPSLGLSRWVATAYRTLVAIYQTEDSYIPEDHTVFKLNITGKHNISEITG
jgi:hypothetical protein